MGEEINDAFGGHKIEEGSTTCQHGNPVYSLQKRCFCAQDAKIKAIHDLGEFSGTLETYFETGMECLGFILHDDRGITNSPSFNNSTKKWDGPIQEFHSIDWTIWLDKKGQKIEVYGEDGSIEYTGDLTLNRQALAKFGYRHSFIPNEVDFDTWCKWFARKAKAKVWKDKF